MTPGAQHGKTLLLYFLAIWLPPALLIAIVTALLVNDQSKQVMQAAVLKQHAEVQAAKELLSERLSGVEADILYLAEQLQQLDSLTQTTGLFENFQRHHPQYYQIRLIDAAGHERVRVELRDGHPHALSQEALQDKSYRYYVQQGQQLPMGSVYLSPFDLNVEHGEVEVPLRPTIRVVTRTGSNHGQPGALVVINYDGQGLLDAVSQLQSSSGAALWLINSNGYWLHSDQPEQTWGFMLPERSDATLSRQHVRLWSQMIRPQAEQTLITDQAMYYFDRLELAGAQQAPGKDALGTLYLVSQLTRQQMSATHSVNAGAFWQAAGLVMLLFALLAALLARSIAQRRASETRLGRSESLFRAMIEAAPDAIIITDAEGTITLLNEQAVAMFDYTQEELLGQKVEVLLPAEVATRHVAHREGYVRAAQPRPMGMGLSLSGRRKDGSQLPVEISLSPINTPEARLIFCAVRDATERRAAERQIRRLNEGLERQNTELQAVNNELEAFSYSVSHDLRAPLRAIDGFSKILQSSLEGTLSERDSDYFNRVRKAAQNMSKLIDDLLTLARVTRADVKLASLNLSRLATTVAERLMENQPERDITLQIEPDIKVLADPALLQVAIENLLGNAFKFTTTQDKALIEVGSMIKDGETVVFVRDNGVGFDMNYADKLFIPFQRLHSASEFPGTGVGLASIKRVMSKLGGRIWAESSVGQGATFYLQFARIGAEQ
ncbi:MAG: PAS domain S-box protein [Pseudomonadota bacterium]|nr:PAS domain S-box protein [Pseudomonadota bacterium]